MDLIPMRRVNRKPAQDAFCTHRVREVSDTWLIAGCDSVCPIS